MTFEKQICKKCKDLTICYHYVPEIFHENKAHVGNWYCDNCFGWVIADANKKDEVSEIFAGIEDLDISV